jgi:uncharacterized protein
MELTNSFTLPVSVDRLWEVLTDVELIAPCVPGFKLEEVADPEYRGTVTVKVGAVTVTYDATITFLDRDEEAHRAVLQVSCKERRGGGRANATVATDLSGEGQEATAEMVTEVEVTGRVAQFGRGIIGEVASQLTRQFVDNLNTQILAARAEGVERTVEPNVAPPSRAPAEEPEALDLGATAVLPMLKRSAPALIALVLLCVLALFKRRR